MTENASADPIVSGQADHQFIERLAKEVRAGFGVVPFIGSGCSSNSGILMGEQFTDYLAWTVFLCLSDRTARPPEFSIPDRWDLRRQGWPEQPTHAQLQVARRWALAELDTLAKACGLKLEPGKQGEEAGICGFRPLDSASFLSPDAVARLLYAPLVPPFLRSPESTSSDRPDSAGPLDSANLRQLHAVFGARGTQTGGLVRPNVSPTSSDAIRERAIRALYDWRATLQFLSELQISEDHTLLLVEPDPAVVDSFNVHITRGRRPNLTHTMLCHLRGPARMRVLLTTNFDTLIEDAFAEQNHRLEVVSVSSKGELANPEIVHARDTVVKLHGSLNETRADFSLDDLPSLADRRRFFHYVRGGFPNEKGERFIPGHLLVLGYSGSDARCVQMMKFVLDSDPRALIFWVCTRSQDLNRVRAIFNESAYRDRIIVTQSERLDLLLYELYQKLCLSLPPGGSVHLLNHHVPPQTSFHPRFEEEEDKEIAATGREVAKALTWLASPWKAAETTGPGSRQKVIVLDGPSGILATLRTTFNTVSKDYRLEKIWLELEDYASTAAVAHEVFRVIAIKSGLYQLRHAQLCPKHLCEPIAASDGAANGTSARDLFQKRLGEWSEHIKRLRHHLGIEPARWLIVLYGRNGPGGCTGWEENRFWDDGGSRREYGDDAGDRQPSTFSAFLLSLADAGFTVLYAPYSEVRRERDEGRRAEIQSALEERSFGLQSDVVATMAKAALDTHFNVPPPHTRRALAAWLGPEGERWRRIDLAGQLNRPLQARTATYGRAIRRVLAQALDLHTLGGAELGRPLWRYNGFYGASLFRQSRHYTAFLIEGILRCPERFNPYGIDNDLVRDELVGEWLDRYNKDPRIFYRKPGGAAWTYRDLRLGVRCLAEVASAASAAASGGDPRSLLPCQERRARAHFYIGDWYLRAFQVSGDANPLMEAAYHFYHCIKHAPEANTRRPEIAQSSLLIVPAAARGPAASDRFLAEYRVAWWRLGLNQLLRTLRLGGPALRFWFGPAETTAWFSGDSASDVPKQVDRSLKACLSDPSTAHEADGDLVALLRAELKQLAERPKNNPRIHTYASLAGIPSRGGSKRGKPLVFTGTQMFGGQTDSFAVEKDKEDEDPVLREPPLDRRDPMWWAGSTSEGLINDLFELTQPFVDGVTEKAPSRVDVFRVEMKGFDRDPARGLVQLQQLVEWSFLLLRRAKREEHAACLIGAEGATSEAIPHEYRITLTPMSCRRQWVRTCLFAQCALDMAAWLGPGADGFVGREMSKTMAIYGVALARLHRFSEAHRRLNHAHALLSGGGASVPAVLHGILEIRRAEVHLLEASLGCEIATMIEASEGEFRRKDADGFQKDFKDHLGRRRYELKNLPQRRQDAISTWFARQMTAVRDEETPLVGLQRQAMARCDDAWSCLERAERLLAGRTHSPRWWGRLRALQLRAFSLTAGLVGRDSVPYRPLTSRIRRDLPGALETLWREGQAAAPDDYYNRVRVLDYYLRALTAHKTKLPWKEDLDGEMKELQAQLESESMHPDESLRAAYQANVRFRVALAKAEIPGGAPAA